MKALKNITLPIFLLFIMASFSQCSSAKKIQDKAPLALDQVYFHKWIAGVKGGGSGINIFVPVKESSVVLDSVFFRGKVVKLEDDTANNLRYVGRFLTEFNTNKEMVFHKDPKKEYGNELPKKENQSMPFELKDDECVISYQNNGKTKYFKVVNIEERESIPLPSAPKDRQ